MSKALQEKLSSIGCLLVIIGVCVFIYLAYTSNWRYLIAAAGLVYFWIRISRMRLSQEEQRDIAALRSIFSGDELKTPQFKRGASYGFPTFTLTFDSESALRQAEGSGHIGSFKQYIQSTYANIGGKQNPFNAEFAIYVTYEGQHPNSKP